MRYFIDSFGDLWSGPFSVEGFDYHGRFDGILCGHPKWSLSSTEPPVDADEITAEQANKIIQRFRDEAIREAFERLVAEMKGEK